LRIAANDERIDHGLASNRSARRSSNPWTEFGARTVF